MVIRQVPPPLRARVPLGVEAQVVEATKAVVKGGAPVGRKAAEGVAARPGEAGEAT